MGRGNRNPLPPPLAQRSDRRPSGATDGKAHGGSAGRDILTLALSRFSRRGAVPACENRSAAPAAPSLLRPLDALGAAATVSTISTVSRYPPKTTKPTVSTISTVSRYPPKPTKPTISTKSRFHGTPRKARNQRFQRNHDSTAPQRNHESNETHENNEMPLLRAFRFFRCVWRNRDFVATVGPHAKIPVRGRAGMQAHLFLYISS